MTQISMIKSIAISLILIASVAAEAQTLDGPGTVCTGTLFEVEWTGPDADNDTIAVAVPQYPADEILDSSPTSDGNPVELRAPFQPGIYELRYVQFEPTEILVKEDLIVEQCLAGGDEQEWPPVAVEARGWQIDHGDQINTSDMSPYGPAGFTLEQFCAASPQVGQVLQMMVDQLEAGMQQAGVPFSMDALARAAGAPTRADIERDVSNGRDAICDNPPPTTTTQPFIITYAYCRMAMRTPTHAMDIHIPVGRDGTMSMADHLTEEVVRMTMRQNFDATTALLGGWGDTIQMDGPGEAASHIGYPTRKYNFEYSGGFGNGPAGIPGITNTIKVKNSGTGWFSAQVPGIDIIRLFYQRMSTDVTPEGSAMSLFGGLINNLVGMLRKGVPLVMDQTTSSSVMGKTMVSGRTQHYITSIKLIDFKPQWCEQTLMPPGYAVTDVDAQLAEAMGSSGMDSEEMTAAMEEYNQAMQQMTPEERQMMEQFGLGGAMSQMGGGANPAAAQPSGSSSTGSNMPSSAELHSDNLTQMVQKHLAALGYDTGNTDGDMSLETTIAISQFQAEKGMAVTGEVTPQLAGVLSAEVDSRRGR